MLNPSKFNWQRIISLLMVYFFGLILMVIPLGMSYFFPIFSPFTLIKTFWLQVLGAIFLILLVLKFRPWQKPLPAFFMSMKFWRAIAPVWLFWLCWLLLSFWSMNFQQSWFGSYSRQLGLMSFFWLAVWHSLFVYRFGGGRQELLVINESRGVTDISWYWRQGVRASALIMAITGTVVSLYAFLQFCGYDFAVWQEPQLFNRAISSLGQPNFLGSFLLLSLPLSIYYGLASTRFGARAAAVLFVFMQFGGLIVSGSRAAWLAGMLTAGLVIVLSTWRRWRMRAIILAILAVALILGTVYLSMPARLSSLLNFNEGSSALRLYFYRAGQEVIVDRPWFGAGLENGAEVVIAKYHPDWGIFMKVNDITDKVHNSILEIIIKFGYLCLVFWDGLNLFCAWQCWRLWKNPQGKLFAIFAGAGMLAYSLSLLFGLADIASVFYFWILAALVVAGNLSLNNQSSIWPRFKMIGRCQKCYHFFQLRSFFKKISGAFFGGVIIVLAIWQIYFCMGSLQADYYFLQLYRLLPARQYFQSGVIYSYILESAHNPVNRNYYQQSFGGSLLVNFSNAPDVATRHFMRLILSEINSSLPSKNYDNIFMHARLNCFLRGGDTAAVDFKKLIELSPRRSSGYYHWGQCLQSIQDEEGALMAYDKALSLLPNPSDWRLNREHRDYLLFYTYLIQKAKAEIYQTRLDYGNSLRAYQAAYGDYPAEVDLLKKVADLYFLQDNFEEAAASLDHAYRRQPSSYQWPLALAAVYKEMGEEVLADLYWQQASVLAPHITLIPLADLTYFP